jgi:hypothetical protein
VDNSSSAWERFRNWQPRIRLTSDHEYLVQKALGGEFVPTSGCTDVIPADKAGINNLMGWATKQAIAAAVEAIKTWDMKTPPEEVLSKCANAHNERRDKAADSGTSMHALFEHEVRLMMGQNPPRPDRTDAQQVIVDKFLAWAQRVNLKPYAVEARVYHPTNDHAGTLDLLASINGGQAEIFDYKPLKPGYSPRLFDKYILQSASYRVSHAEMCGLIKPLGGRIIFYPTVENAGADFADREVKDDVTQAYAAFVGCLQFYRWGKRNQGRRRQKKAA